MPEGGGYGVRTITIYGPGCAKCDLAEKIVRRVVADLHADVRVEKIGDVAALARAGVTSTPLIAVDGVTVMMGRVPSEGDVEDWLCE